MPSRACQASQPSHFCPVAPGRHMQSPVTGSQGTGREPSGSHSHSWQEPPGLLGLPAYPGAHLDLNSHKTKLIISHVSKLFFICYFSMFLLFIYCCCLCTVLIETKLIPRVNRSGVNKLFL